MFTIEETRKKFAGTEIHVAVPGSLSNLIREDEKYKIKRMRVSGFLNSHDILFIKDMCAYNNTEGQLAHLDLKDTQIVSGDKISHEYKGDKIAFYTKERSITKYMFAGCFTLKELRLPDNTKLIEQCSFWNCCSLYYIVIPENTVYIDPLAFPDCNNLGIFQVSKNNNEYTSIKGLLYNKDMTELILCPPGIGRYKDKITLPNTLNELKEDIFYSCSTAIFVLILPPSIKYISKNVFRTFTTPVRYLVIQSEHLEIECDTFSRRRMKIFCFSKTPPYCDGDIGDITLFVYPEYQSIYETDPFWSKCAIIGMSLENLDIL